MMAGDDRVMLTIAAVENPVSGLDDVAGVVGGIALSCPEICAHDIQRAACQVEVRGDVLHSK